MGFKDAARGFVKGFFTPNQSNINIANALPNTAINYQAKVGRGLRSSVVMAPVHWAARSFAELRPAVSFDSETVSEHALLDLYRNPNQFYTGSDLQSAVIMSYLLSGNAYVLMVRDERTNQPVELWYAPHWMIKPVGDENNFIAHYEYRPDGRGGKRVIAPSDVLHFRCGIDPEDVRLGISPLASLWREIYTDDEASNYTASLLRNQGLAGAIISPAAGRTVAPSEMTAARRYITERLTGDRRGQPIIMSGSTTITQPSFSPQNMMLGELRNVPEERVCAILGIPAAVVGLGTGLQATKVGATMKESVRLAWTGCLLPMARTFESTINSSLLREFETSQSAGFVFSSEAVAALKDDQNEAVTRTKELYSAGIISRAQALSSLGIEPREGDEDIYSGPQPQSEGMFGEMLSRSSAPPELKARMTRKQAQLLRALDKIQDDTAEEMSSKLRSVFKDLGKSAASVSTTIMSKSHAPGKTKELSEEEAERAADDMMSGLEIALLASIASLKNIGEDLYLEVALKTYEELSKFVGDEVVMSPNAKEELLSESAAGMKKIDVEKQTKDAIAAILAEAREEDLTEREIVKRISEKVERGRYADSETRAKVISRTEAMNAGRRSTVKAYSESGRFTHLVMFDGRSGATDEECMERDGKLVKIEEASSHQPFHPNCTLTFAPHIEI